MSYAEHITKFIRRVYESDDGDLQLFLDVGDSNIEKVARFEEHLRERKHESDDEIKSSISEYWELATSLNLALNAGAPTIAEAGFALDLHNALVREATRLEKESKKGDSKERID